MRGRDIVGWNIRRLRVERGIAQERLAFDAGIDRSYLGGLERGLHNPTIDLVQRLADTLDVELAELVRSPPEGAQRLPSLAAGRKKS